MPAAKRWPMRAVPRRGAPWLDWFGDHPEPAEHPAPRRVWKLVETINQPGWFAVVGPTDARLINALTARVPEDRRAWSRYTGALLIEARSRATAERIITEHHDRGMLRRFDVYAGDSLIERAHAEDKQQLRELLTAAYGPDIATSLRVIEQTAAVW